jgi:hypothetical protein
MAKILCHHYRDKGWDLPYIVSSQFSLIVLFIHMSSNLSKEYTAVIPGAKFFGYTCFEPAYYYYKNDYEPGVVERRKRTQI